MNTLHVTQNKTADGENTDKVTIALQENTIGQLNEQIEQQKAIIEELQSSQETQIDYAKLTQNVSVVFTKISDCSCGLMSNSNGEYILLTATASKSLTTEEEQAIRNWLAMESKITDIRFQCKRIPL